jgi:rhodanese-related sulfurtransferase
MMKTERMPIVQRSAAAATLALATLLGGLSVTHLAGCTAKISDRAVQDADVAQLARWLEREPERYAVVDVRSAEAFARGHLPSARRLSLAEASDGAPSWARRAKAVIVYGEDPGSATAVAMTKRLMDQGLTSVYLLREGFTGWAARGLPVER